MDGCSFQQVYGKIWFSFCLNTGKHFFLEVSFSSQQKEHRKSIVAISENCEHFQYFNFETDFLENENFFKKTGEPFFV